MAGSELFGNPLGELRAAQGRAQKLEDKLAAQKAEYEAKLLQQENRHAKAMKKIKDENDQIKRDAYDHEKELNSREATLKTELETLRSNLADFRRREASRAREANVDAVAVTKPDHSSPSIEQKWLRTHPAMRRNSTAATIHITTEDIEDAPSKWAINQLSHWCNLRNEFFKQAYAEDRKAMADEGNSLIRDETPADWAHITKEIARMEHARKQAVEGN